MHCLKSWVRILALASVRMVSGRVKRPRDVTQLPLDPRPEQVVKDGDDNIAADSGDSRSRRRL